MTTRDEPCLTRAAPEGIANPAAKTDRFLRKSLLSGLTRASRLTQNRHSIQPRPCGINPTIEYERHCATRIDKHTLVSHLRRPGRPGATGWRDEPGIAGFSQLRESGPF
jgi:hypothetical protein